MTQCTASKRLRCKELSNQLIKANRQNVTLYQRRILKFSASRDAGLEVKQGTNDSRLTTTTGVKIIENRVYLTCDVALGK
jgi:hypothetical protein